MLARALVALAVVGPVGPALSPRGPQSVQSGPVGAAAAGAQLRYSARNLGVASHYDFYGTEGLVQQPLVVLEASQGGTDLNGDGDAVDRVVHLADPITGNVVNLGLATNADELDDPAVSGRFIFDVSEASQGGSDLNGDGDALDQVLFVHGTNTGVSANLGHALGSFWGRSISSDLVAFSVSEAADGGADLNGDGDSVDSVVFVYDLVQGTSHNLGLAQHAQFLSITAEGSLVGCLVGEVAQGQDLNGDGEIKSIVPHVYDHSQGLVINLGVISLSTPVLGQGLAVYLAPEGPGVDLNGDGDFADRVAQMLDPVKGTTTNTGLAGYIPTLTDTHLILPVREQDQGGMDLNGDGDAMDTILHARDLASGVTTHAPLDWTFSDLYVVGQELAILVIEKYQGNTDLNGDGDTMDGLLFLFDPVTAAIRDTGVASALVGSDYIALGHVHGGQRYLGMSVLELAQGETDLDGDGDHVHQVWHTFDRQTGVLTNTGRGNSYGGFGGGETDLLVFLTGETAWGGKDLNGDGDAADQCLTFWDAKRDQVVNVALAVTNFGIVVRDRNALFLVDEARHGGKDLNGDGDALDFVLFQLIVN
jgi:hypothetical protein